MNGRKLQLNRETIRTLSAQEMAGVAGGAVLKHGTCTCVNCTGNCRTNTCPAPKMALMIR